MILAFRFCTGSVAQCVRWCSLLCYGKLKSKIKLFKARNNINRGKILSPVDAVYTNENFTRLKHALLRSLHGKNLRVKKRIAVGKIIYQRDVEQLPIVLKKKVVNAKLVSGSIQLEFQAVSLQDGYLNDIIEIKKSDGKVLKAKVIGKNMVEVL